jgi:hypothetical protein
VARRILDNMKRVLATVALCSALSAVAQIAPNNPRFAGCYEVKILRWSPPLEDTPTKNLIPSVLQLSTIRSEPDHDVFDLHSVPVNPHALPERFWFWTSEGSSVRVSFGTGMGGLRGILKTSSNGELSGKLKQWCDKRCEWKKTEVRMSLRRIDCPK